MIEIEEMTESKGVKQFCSDCEAMLIEAQDFQDENQMEKGRVASLNWLLDTREKDIIEKSKLIKENEKEIMLLKQKRQEEIEKIESYKIKIKELEENLSDLKDGKDKLIIIKDADPEMEGKLKTQQVKVESLEMEKREIENKGDLNLEKF